MRWRQPKVPKRDDMPDLQTQYEQLLDAVWRCEREARLDDRIALRSRLDEARSRRC